MESPSQSSSQSSSSPSTLLHLSNDALLNKISKYDGVMSDLLLNLLINTGHVDVVSWKAEEGELSEKAKQLLYMDINEEYVDDMKQLASQLSKEYVLLEERHSLKENKLIKTLDNIRDSLNQSVYMRIARELSEFQIYSDLLYEINADGEIIKLNANILHNAIVDNVCSVTKSASWSSDYSQADITTPKNIFCVKSLEKSGVLLRINIILGSVSNMRFKYIGRAPAPSLYLKEDHCSKCLVGFNFTKIHNNCRGCGKSYCSSCVKKVRLASKGYDFPVLTCSDCIDEDEFAKYQNILLLVPVIIRSYSVKMKNMVQFNEVEYTKICEDYLNDLSIAYNVVLACSYGYYPRRLTKDIDWGSIACIIIRNMTRFMETMQSQDPRYKDGKGVTSSVIYANVMKNNSLREYLKKNVEKMRRLNCDILHKMHKIITCIIVNHAIYTNAHLISIITEFIVNNNFSIILFILQRLLQTTVHNSSSNVVLYKMTKDDQILRIRNIINSAKSKLNIELHKNILIAVDIINRSKTCIDEMFNIVSLSENRNNIDVVMILVLYAYVKLKSGFLDPKKFKPMWFGMILNLMKKERCSHCISTLCEDCQAKLLHQCKLNDHFESYPDDENIMMGKPCKLCTRYYRGCKSHECTLYGCKISSISPLMHHKSLIYYEIIMPMIFVTINDGVADVEFIKQLFDHMFLINIDISHIAKFAYYMKHVCNEKRLYEVGGDFIHCMMKILNYGSLSTFHPKTDNIFQMISNLALISGKITNGKAINGKTNSKTIDNERSIARGIFHNVDDSIYNSLFLSILFTLYRNGINDLDNFGAFCQDNMPKYDNLLVTYKLLSSTQDHSVCDIPWGEVANSIRHLNIRIECYLLNNGLKSSLDNVLLMLLKSGNCMDILYMYSRDLIDYDQLVNYLPLSDVPNITDDEGMNHWLLYNYIVYQKVYCATTKLKSACNIISSIL
jgi:hypothetical protein